MKKLGISVIIPLYNKRATVARAIESVFAQTGVKVEVLVVDDGSSDGSEAVVARFGDRVRYVRQVNQGPSAARNHGARISRLPLLVFLDADDELEMGCLEAHVASHNKSEIVLSLAGFHVWHGKKLARTENLVDRVELPQCRYGLAVVEGFNFCFVANVASGAICINRELFFKVKGFDDYLRCWEITEFLYRVMLERPMVALPLHCYITVHEDVDKGQFARTRQDTSYQMVFAKELITGLDSVPPGQRKQVFDRLINIQYNIIQSGDADVFIEFGQLICKFSYIQRKIRKICLIIRMPRPLVLIFLKIEAWRYHGRK